MTVFSTGQMIFRDGDGSLATQEEDHLVRQLSTLKEYIQNIYIYRNVFLLANQKVGKLLLIADTEPLVRMSPLTFYATKS